ncbi:DeoR/GlpR family DNA-binding transcription regulator [Leeia sp.]|uniref:DeoR/GlpR family DNA-binding transcription regulator n=1 Tax=Leeia sp. TaxID=2884678 RepID=UPI0035AF86C9
MWHQERHQRIRALLATQQRVSTDRIVAELGVSRETVRRDLLEMEAAGSLKRVHGGAIRVEDEAPIAERAQSKVQAKRALARAAVGLLSEGQTVFIDAGTTTALLAEELARLANLTIITNAIDVALALRGSEGQLPRHEVILLGGQPNPRAPATIGAQTVAEIARYRADLALLSPVGIEVEFGASSYDAQEAAVARAMAEHAQQRILLADYSKIGLRSRISWCRSADIHCLITNQRAELETSFSQLQQAVQRVIRV